MDRNLTLQASLKAHGPIWSNQSIELNKLNNFRSICVKKIFTSKKLWIKMFYNFVEIFLSIFGSRRASAPLEPQNWKWNHEDNHALSTFTQNFSFVAFIVFEEKSGQQDPLKLRKFAISQNRKWRHQNKKKYIKFLCLCISPENFMKIDPTDFEKSSAQNR